MQPLTVAKVQAALVRMPDKTGLGLDWWEPAGLKSLPDGYISELTDILRSIETQRVWPTQLLMMIVCLLPKPDPNSDRPICLLPCLARLWARTRKDVFTDWTHRCAGAWDTAVAGSSALQAAMQRAIEDETDRTLGLCTGGIFWDLEKFYDDISVVLLCKRVAECGYPSVALSLALQLYLCVRVLTLESAASQWVQPHNSILAGDAQANNMAKVILMSVLLRLSEAYPMVKHHQYVDDLTQRASGTVNEVVVSLSDAGTELANAIWALGHSISPKSTAVSSILKVAVRIVQNLSTSGCVIKAGTHVRDLGIDSGGGQRRRVPTASARERKAASRTKRLRRMGHVTSGVIQKLWKAGARPQSICAAPCTGLTPSRAAALRTAAAEASQCWKPGRCLTTAIALMYGMRQDPVVVTMLSMFRAWILAWRHSRSRAALARAWVSLRDKIKKVPSHSRWQYARGPISTMICQLLGMGWLPNLPNSWVDEVGDTWLISPTPDDDSLMVKAIQRAVEGQYWAKASLYHCGKGLEQGADMVGETRHLRALRRVGKHREAGMLQALVTAGVWTAERAAQASGEEPQQCCLMCGEGPDTEVHRYWSCPALASFTAEAVQRTQHLARQAIELAAEQPCLWLRGVLPRSLVTVPEPAPATTCEAGEAIGSPLLRAARAYVDGSGTSPDPRLRRCGWAVALLDTQGAFRAAWFGALGDSEPHYVARSELTAALRALEHVEGPLEIVSDCIYVVYLFNSKGYLRSQSSHADMWRQIAANISIRESPVTMRWAKAHATESEVLSHRLTAETVVGNAVADAFAKEGAKLNPVPCHVVGMLRAYEELAYNIRQRLVHINLHITGLPEFKKYATQDQNDHPAKPTVRTEARQQRRKDALAATSHTIVVQGGRQVCTQCKQGCSIKVGTRWLEERPQCLGRAIPLDAAPAQHIGEQASASSVGPSGAHRPQQASRFANLCVANGVVHDTHRVASFRGYFWCWACGSVSSVRAKVLKGLSQPCTLTPGKAGKEKLKRLSRGLPPVAGTPWPEPGPGRVPLPPTGA